MTSKIKFTSFCTVFILLVFFVFFAALDNSLLANEQQDTLNSATITTIFTDGFEDPGFAWDLSAQNNAASPGYGYTWFYSNGARYRTGEHGCWCSHYVMFGGNPVLDPQTDPYARGSDSWMTRGPFDFSGTNDGGFEFWYWLDSEMNDDQLRYQISTNGTNFYGYQKSGNSGGWQKATIDLKNVPTLGNVCGEPQVWVRIGFVSDTDMNTGEGAYVDDAWLWKQAGPSCSISVTSPNGGEDWDEKTQQTITWNKSGTCSDVKIEYSTNGGGAWTTIVNNTSNDGSYNWMLPDVSSDKTQCLVKVSCTSASCSDQSDNYFTIRNKVCTITVTSPNGGETWADGSTKNITWNSSGTSGNVKIRYSTNSGSNWMTITNSTPDNGTYSWTIPDVGSDQTNCRVRVEDVNNSSCNDVSNSDFTIEDDEVCSIIVTSPNGGEIWVEGSTQNILWNSSNTSGSVNIYYSTNGGTNWMPIAVPTNDDGTEAWTLPSVTSDNTNCLVKIEDVSNSGCKDVSDANFTIKDVPPPGGVPIYPSATSPQNVGDEFWVDIIVGNATNPVSNFFAVSFELNYTNSTYLDVVTPSSSNVIPGVFLGNDVVFIQNVDESAGKVSIGISRKAGQGNVNGIGTIARIKFISNNSTPDGTTILFSLSNVSANDSVGAAVALSPNTLTVILNQGLTVWPGDTNNDGIVNQADVLPIGLYWNSTGPVRPSASLSWTGQSCPKWTPPNATYADANGDGVVNQGEILAIGLNWNKTHTLLSSLGDESPQVTKPNSPTFFMNITGNTKPNEYCWVEFVVENVTDLFGISFEMSFSPTTYIETIEAENGSWVGDDIIFYPMIETTEGKVSFGISRKAGQGGISGTGTVATIKMKTKDIPAVLTELSFKNVVANDPLGNTIQLNAVNNFITSVGDEKAGSIPNSFRLLQNYPNPFNPETTIEYNLSAASEVKLTVYDINGRQIRGLVRGQKDAGNHSAVWNALDESGNVVSSGVYFYQIEIITKDKKSQSFFEVRKMILMK